MADFRTPFGLRRQLRLLLPLLVTWTGAAIALAVAGTQRWTSLEELFLDASYLGGQPWYSGILNEAGLISWAIAVCAAGIGSWVAAMDGRHRAARFLGWGAVVVAVMLIDVWIQFHSSVAPRLGIDANLAQAMIAAAGLAWFTTFWREITRTRWLIVVTSGGILACSAGIDAFISPHGAMGLWLEDAARLVGILTLTHYLVVTTVDIIRSVVAERTARADAADLGSAALSAAVVAALGSPRPDAASIPAPPVPAPADLSAVPRQRHPADRAGAAPSAAEGAQVVLRSGQQ